MHTLQIQCCILLWKQQLLVSKLVLSKILTTLDNSHPKEFVINPIKLIIPKFKYYIFNNFFLF